MGTHSQTSKMLQLISLAGLMAALSKGIPMQSPECCDSKDVGGVSYSLVGQMDTTAYQCLNNCIYVKDQDPTVKFCFASGDLQVECTEDEFQGSDKPPMGGSDKPPMEGTDKPPMEGSDKPPTEAPAGTTPAPQTVTIPQRSWAYMTNEMNPSTGPMTNMTYQSGIPGGQWTDDEVKATRLRILQMIHPNWDVKKAQGTLNGLGVKTEKG